MNSDKDTGPKKTYRIEGPGYVPAGVDPGGNRATRRKAGALKRRKVRKLRAALARAGCPLTYEQRTPMGEALQAVQVKALEQELKTTDTR